MAVYGEINGQPVTLNNAAEEATLRDILDVLSGATSGGRIFDSSAARQLSSSTRQASGGIMGMLGAAYRTEDGLDRLTRAQRESRNALNSFTTSAYAYSRNLAQGLASGDLSRATQGIFDTIQNTAKGFIDVVQKSVKNPLVDFGLELAKIGIDIGIGGAAYVENKVREFGTKFSDLANAGFIMGEGVSEFRNNLNKAGITFAEFEGMVKNNGDALRVLGGTASQGARQVIKMRAAMVGQEEQFLRLGYNIDDLSPMIAEYAASLERGVGTMALSDQDLVGETAKYAVNLRKLTDLTGKSADQFNKEAEAAARRSQNQSYLMSLEQNNVKGASRTFGSLFELVQQKFPGYENLLSDYFTQIGVAQDETTALLESTNPALAAALKDMKYGVESGAITQTNAADAFVAAIQARQEGIRAGQAEEARLAGFRVSGFEGIGTSIVSLDEITRLNTSAALEQYKAALTNKDAATQSIIDIQRAANNFTLASEQVSTSLVEKFGPILTGAIDYAAQKLREFGNYLFAESTRGPRTADQTRELEAQLEAQSQRMIRENPGLGPVPTQNWDGYGPTGPGSARPRIVPGQELNPVQTPIPPYARGGIIPNVGPEGMPIRAGDGVAEAVVPLPDGRSIPVTMRDNQAFKDMSSKLDLMTSINRAMLDAIEENNRLVKLGNNLIS